MEFSEHLLHLREILQRSFPIPRLFGVKLIRIAAQKGASTTKTAGKKHPVGRRTKLELERAASDSLSHLKGEKTFPTRKISIPNPVDVKQIREAAQMSQSRIRENFLFPSSNLPGLGTRQTKAGHHNRKAVVQALQSESVPQQTHYP